MASAIVDSIELYENADFSKQYTLLDDTGAAVNLTGATFECKFRRTYAATSADITGSGSIVNAANGTFKITATDTDINTAVTALAGSFPAEPTNPASRTSQSSYVTLYFDATVIISGIRTQAVRGVARLYRSATR